MSDKLLSLCLIVGPGEADELERCLESCKGDLFDEVCITHAAKEIDKAVEKVAKRYTDNFTFFEWCADFSKARNYNFSQASGKHIFWIDADDIIKPEDYEKIKALKPKLTDYDLIMVQYVYAHDNKDRPVVVLPRERIVRNCGEIKWHDPIHEYLNMNSEFRMKKESDIYVHHYRTKPFDPDRNLTLLKKAYGSEKVSPRIRFYYGKELADNGKWAEATPVLEDYINRGEGFQDNLAVACIKLSRYYYSQKKLNDAKATAMKGIHFNRGYAENYVLLGDAYWDQGNKETAISYYEEALTKKLGGTGMSQLADYYRFIPAWRLATVYTALHDFDKAEKYCKIGLGEKPEHKELTQLLPIIQRQKMLRTGEVVLKDNVIKEFDALSNKYSLDLEYEDNNVEFARIKINKRATASIAWLVPVLDLSNPSIRLRRYNVHEKLKEIGVESTLITNYYGKSVYDIRNQVGNASVVVMTQFSQEDFEIMRYLKTQGKKLAYDHNEALFGYPMEGECFKEADAMVCCSSVLAQMTKSLGFGPVAVIRDAYEDNFEFPTPVYADRYEKPKAVYMGMGGNSFLANEWLRPVIEEAGYDLVVITEWDNATIKWNPKTWPQDLCNCDVVLCPQRADVQPAKSNVKATTAMSLGLPVIGSAIQSYREVIEHGKNGYLAQDLKGWKAALEELKDPKVRERVGRSAKGSVSAYSLDAIARNWKQLCLDLTTGKVPDKSSVEVKAPEVAPKARDQVDIIIANYNNLPYLKLLYNSIMLNTLYPFHLVISDAGSDAETWEFLKTLRGVTIIGEQGKRKNFSEACNDGITATNSKYFALLNSDLIVSKGWLTNIVEKMETQDRLAACGVLSNCDRGWLHGVPGRPNYPMCLEESGIELIPGMKYEQIEPRQEELFKFMDQSNRRIRGKFVEQEWVAFYATVFARSAVAEVGLLDPMFKNGCEDLDLCRRLSKFDYKMGQSLDSFVFHFGGVSRGAYQEENRDSYNKEDRMNHVLCHKKWENKRVVIWTGRAWEPWNKQKVDEGMAGSETWAAYLAESLVKKGYDVTVYNDLLVEDQSQPLLEPVTGTDDKFVRYRHYPHMLSDLQYQFIDHVIVSRSTEPLAQRFHTHNHYVMIHDIWLSQGRNYDIKSWKVQKYAYLSEWHKQFLMHHHNMPEDKMFLTANGVSQELYEDVDSGAKKNQAVYSSSPDRGLYQLLQMVPLIRAEIPDFELVVAYGFYNWEEAAKMRDDKLSMQLIAKIKKLLDQPGVNYVDRVDKRTLAQYQKESKVWLYPSWFSETFCIGASENGLSRNALLSTAKAGLLTTVGDAGILLPSDGLTRDQEYPKEFRDNFVKEAIRLFKDEEYRKLWAGKAYGKMLSYSWDKIADDWVALFQQYEKQ